jgi:hypothetical protein
MRTSPDNQVERPGHQYIERAILVYYVLLTHCGGAGAIEYTKSAAASFILGSRHPTCYIGMIGGTFTDRKQNGHSLFLSFARAPQMYVNLDRRVLSTHLAGSL